MIITCINCNKKFKIDGALIPSNGRKLECSNCNHKWFFKNIPETKFIEPMKNDDLEFFDPVEVIKSTHSESDKNININDKINPSLGEALDKTTINKSKNLKKYNFLNLLIVFIVSFVALVLLTDTFKVPISKIFPNIELLLYNLYETLKDIALFSKDLI